MKDSSIKVKDLSTEEIYTIVKLLALAAYYKYYIQSLNEKVLKLHKEVEKYEAQKSKEKRNKGKTSSYKRT